MDQDSYKNFVRTTFFNMDAYSSYETIIYLTKFMKKKRGF